MTDDAIDLGGGVSLVIVPADARDAVRKIVQERDALRAEVAEMEAEVHGHIKMWGDELRLRKAAEAERRWIMEERDRTFALMLARAIAAEAERDRLREALVRIADLTSHDMGMTAEEERCVNREALAALTTKGDADERA
jgi:hypothetical protein